MPRPDRVGFGGSFKKKIFLVYSACTDVSRKVVKRREKVKEEKMKYKGREGLSSDSNPWERISDVMIARSKEITCWEDGASLLVDFVKSSIKVPGMNMN